MHLYDLNRKAFVYRTNGKISYILLLYLHEIIG